MPHIDSLDSREWWYFPIIMPTLNGHGPASEEECDTITFEVWSKCLSEVFGPFDNLYCALNKAMELNNG